MQACTLGGMAISHTGTSLPHGLSYRVTCELGTPHGKAVGMFLDVYKRQVYNPRTVNHSMSKHRR